MAVLDKEIKVIMLKGERGTNGQDGQDGQDGQNGQDGKSSYDLAVENLLFSGTLEEWIETFATPENYFTRAEIQRVTQAEYDELVETGQVAPNCYYLITDDDTLETLQSLLSTLQNNKVEKVTSNNDYTSSITNSGNEIELQVAKENGNNLSFKINDDDINIYGEDENGDTIVDFNLLDIEGRITTLEGKHLYKHDIQINIPYAQSQDENGTVIITLYTSSATPITTLNEIKSYINASGSAVPSMPAGGTLTRNGNEYSITHLEKFLGSLIAVYLYYNSSNYWQTVDCYIDSKNPTISDGVTQVF